MGSLPSLTAGKSLGPHTEHCRIRQPRGSSVARGAVWNTSRIELRDPNDERPGVTTVIVMIVVGVLGVVWGVGEYLLGNPYRGVFAILGVVTIYCSVDYYFRVARHLDDR